MNISYWEKQHFFSGITYCIAGAGIVGLSTALCLRKKYPKARILILERALVGAAASSKNAGFACFGSVSEILDDISRFGEETAFELIEMRWKGLQLLRKTLGNKNLDFKSYGGYELFTSPDIFDYCAGSIPRLNSSLSYIGNKVYAAIKKESFGFRNVHGIISNAYEGQVDTGKMYFALEKMCLEKGILILRGIGISSYVDEGNCVQITPDNMNAFKASSFLITNNGFARQLLDELPVEPARAQVLITEPLKNLKIKGTFHYDTGYYYFRNINDRILIGGGRNADLENERTYEQQTTRTIQERIENLLFDVVLGKKVKIEQRWAGTMGVGESKYPVIKSLSRNVHCGIRMGGMGVAIGSLVGKKLSELA